MKKINLTALALLLLCPLTSGAFTVEKIVATVNGEAITSSDLDEAVKRYGPELQKTDNISGNTLRAQVLNNLIDERILEDKMRQAEDDPNIKVEPHEVDAYIDRILRSSRIPMKQFEDELAKKGMTITQYRQELQKQLLRNKFISGKVGRKINISERELKDYFDAHMDDFKSVSSVQLSQISIPFTEKTGLSDLERIEELAVRITRAAGTTPNFELLAKEFSGKPFTVHGGSLGVVQMADLQPAIAQMAAELEIGQVSGPIVTETGVHIIKVTDRSKTSARDFTSVRDRVYDAVYQIKMQNAIKAYVKELRRNAQVDIRGLGI